MGCNLPWDCAVAAWHGVSHTTRAGAHRTPSPYITTARAGATRSTYIPPVRTQTYTYKHTDAARPQYGNRTTHTAMTQHLLLDVYCKG